MSTRTFVCPKCESRLVGVRRYPPGHLCLGSPETLRCTCERCRHTWNEKPSDTQEETP